MKKNLILLLVIIFIFPQIAFASWWNPFSWFNFLSKKSEPKIIEKIIYLPATTSPIEIATSTNSATTSFPQKNVKQETLPKKTSTEVSKPTAPIISNQISNEKVVEKDYEKLYKDSFYKYSNFRISLRPEESDLDNSLLTPTQSNYRIYLKKLIASLTDDMLYLSQIEMIKPKPANTIDAYTLKINQYISDYNTTKTRYWHDLEQEKKDQVKNQVISFIKTNKPLLGQPSVHITMATLFDLFDKNFNTNYAFGFKATKTDVEAVEYANSFLIDMGQNTI